jgi:hypothetical protein
MGATGSALYNGSLSVYFVAVIKFGMKDKTFKRKLEFWCHFIPSAYAIGSSIFLQAGGYFNSMGGEYYIIDNRLLTMIVEIGNLLTLLLLILPTFSQILCVGYLLCQLSASAILTSNALAVERTL